MNELQKQYVKTVATMSTDCLMGGITYQTFLANLDMIVMQLQEMEWDEETKNRIMD